jgi:hypothetical protein
MKLRQLKVFALVILVVILNYSIQNLPDTTTAQTTPDVYVGIDIAYGDVEETKALIDQASSYTNLIIFGCTGITRNNNYLNETCQYAYDKGMYFIVYEPRWSTDYSPGGNLYRNGSLTYEEAKGKWGEHLLGIYRWDEPGGKQIDSDGNRYSWGNPSSYSEAADQFEQTISNQGLSRLLPLNCSLFTSDYAAYWFDYNAGYTDVFAEFGWNYSRQLNVAMCRGAATVQGGDWGVMITWTYTHPPYIESGDELYEDMVLAYDSGAKYIIVFDANEGWTDGILQEEHLQAMKKFWKYVQENPRNTDPIDTRTAYALPADYAYGFRGPTDRIWGLAEANETEYNLAIMVNYLLEVHGTKLDIIYDDELEEGNNYRYGSILYWDTYDPMPSPSPTPTPIPTETLIPSPSPTSTPTISPTLSPSQSSTMQPTATTDSQNDFGLSNYVYVVVGIGVVLGIGATALVLRKKR